MKKCVNEDCQYFREHGECSEVCTNQGIMKIVTNIDKLRSMTVEELAQWFAELIEDTKEHEYSDEYDDWLEWLQRENSIDN